MCLGGAYAGGRSVIREAFGTEPYETYAATETAGIGSDCRLHGMHPYEDLVITELVDDDGSARHLPQSWDGRTAMCTWSEIGRQGSLCVDSKSPGTPQGEY